mmetsp:Transcript_1977/g.6833  ORF Transcript_1977/g.6833 Transcript_1977/m.6833 type:complete len:324 (+) Transcript_1977:905-1876(+)
MLLWIIGFVDEVSPHDLLESIEKASLPDTLERPKHQACRGLLVRLLYQERQVLLGVLVRVTFREFVEKFKKHFGTSTGFGDGRGSERSPGVVHIIGTILGVEIHLPIRMLIRIVYPLLDEFLSDRNYLAIFVYLLLLVLKVRKPFDNSRLLVQVQIVAVSNSVVEFVVEATNLHLEQLLDHVVGAYSLRLTTVAVVINHKPTSLFDRKIVRITRVLSSTERTLLSETIEILFAVVRRTKYYIFEPFLFEYLHHILVLLLDCLGSCRSCRFLLRLLLYHEGVEFLENFERHFGKLFESSRKFFVACGFPTDDVPTISPDVYVVL